MQDYALFLEEFKEKGGIWVMKPSGAAEGKGIFLFSKLSAVHAWAKPHLIRRMKRSAVPRPSLKHLHGRQVLFHAHTVGRMR